MPLEVRERAWFKMLKVQQKIVNCYIPFNSLSTYFISVSRQMALLSFYHTFHFLFLFTMLFDLCLKGLINAKHCMYFKVHSSVNFYIFWLYFLRLFFIYSSFIYLDYFLFLIRYRACPSFKEILIWWGL